MVDGRCGERGYLFSRARSWRIENDGVKAIEFIGLQRITIKIPVRGSDGSPYSSRCSPERQDCVARCLGCGDVATDRVGKGPEPGKEVGNFLRTFGRLAYRCDQRRLSFAGRLKKGPDRKGNGHPR